VRKGRVQNCARPSCAGKLIVEPSGYETAGFGEYRFASQVRRSVLRALLGE
jgi:hypothetical protein